MLRLENISKIYPHAEVLRDVTWELKSGDRIGLVGPNGSGKSTQFKIMVGELEPTSGQVMRAPELQIGYLNQEFAITPSNTVKEELEQSFAELNTVSKALSVVHKKLEHATGSQLDKLIHEMDQLQREFEHQGGYLQDGKIDKVLLDMGFETTDANRLISEFSGGWQMRMNLAKILLHDPDVLLLDEPTNHIDLETIEWLESYLRKQNKPMAIISHDRQFLDRVCTGIVEMKRGKATFYLGNYSAYMASKEMNEEAQRSAYERQQKELGRQQVFVDRFRASATRSTQAKSREKQLDKIERLEAPDSDERTLAFRFPEVAHSGLEVATIKNVTHAYGDKILFMDANLHIKRGDRIAILGANGAGKSTLLRLITGKENPMGGEIALGQHNVRVAYFEQNQAEALDLNKTVLATITDEVPQWKTEEIRALLGRFLFTGDAIHKKVISLSGGEKARLALAKMLLGSNNFLILDEPTNHLDIPAKETLETALKKFAGTVIVVSHDRYFISKIANKIVDIRDNQLCVYHGNYQYYLDRVEAAKQSVTEAQVAEEAAARAAEKRAHNKAKEKAKSQKNKLVSALFILLFGISLGLASVSAFAQGPPRGYGGDDFPDDGGPPPFGPRGGRFGPPGGGFGPPRGSGRPNFSRPQQETARQQPDEYVLSALSPQEKKSTFNGNVRASIVGKFLDVKSNGIPNHPTASYPNEHNPNSILEQDYDFHIPLNPKMAAQTMSLPFGPIGVAINGIPFYNPYNAQGMDAVLGPYAEVFDSCCGHPDPMGRYHYHKYPICVNSPFRDPSGKHSPIIGWAFDGFALYGPNGEDGQPPKDLDKCNGHVDAMRGYHYHVTKTFPYILGAYRGVVEMSNFQGPVWGH